MHQPRRDHGRVDPERHEDLRRLYPGLRLRLAPHQRQRLLDELGPFAPAFRLGKDRIQPRVDIHHGAQPPDVATAASADGGVASSRSSR